MPPKRQDPRQVPSGAQSTLGLDRLSAPPRGRLLVGLAVAAILAVYLATRAWFIHRFPYFVDEAQYAYYTDRAAHSLHDLFISYAIGREPLHMARDPAREARRRSADVGSDGVDAMWAADRSGGWAARSAARRDLGWPGSGRGVRGPALLPGLRRVGNDGVAGDAHHGERTLRADRVYGARDSRSGRSSVPSWLPESSPRGTHSRALALLPLSLVGFDWAASDRQARLRSWLTGVALAAVMVAGAGLLLHSSSRFPEFQHFRQTPFYTVRSLHDVLVDPFGELGRRVVRLPPGISRVPERSTPRGHSGRCAARLAARSAADGAALRLDRTAARSCADVRVAPVPPLRPVRDASDDRPDGIRPRLRVRVGTAPAIAGRGQPVLRRCRDAVVSSGATARRADLGGSRHSSVPGSRRQVCDRDQRRRSMAGCGRGDSATSRRAARGDPRGLGDSWNASSTARPRLALRLREGRIRARAAGSFCCRRRGALHRPTSIRIDAKRAPCLDPALCETSRGRGRRAVRAEALSTRAA